MTTNTDVTEPVMMELSEVSDIGMLARVLVDVVMLALYIYINIFIIKLRIEVLRKQKH